MKYLLDTCLLSELQKPRPYDTVAAWFAEQPDHSLYISVMTIGEIRKGIDRLETSSRQSRLDQWLQSLVAGYDDRILPVSLEVAESWGVLSARAARLGRPLPIVDGLIASTARVRGLCVVTRNTGHFVECGVEVVNPWAEDRQQ